jgi:hypothetical protein
MQNLRNTKKKKKFKNKEKQTNKQTSNETKKKLPPGSKARQDKINAEIGGIQSEGRG